MKVDVAVVKLMPAPVPPSASSEPGVVEPIPTLPLEFTRKIDEVAEPDALVDDAISRRAYTAELCAP